MFAAPLPAVALMPARSLREARANSRSGWQRFAHHVRCIVRVVGGALSASPRGPSAAAPPRTRCRSPSASAVCARQPLPLRGPARLRCAGQGLPIRSPSAAASGLLRARLRASARPPGPPTSSAFARCSVLRQGQALRALRGLASGSAARLPSSARFGARVGLASGAFSPSAAASAAFGVARRALRPPGPVPPRASVRAPAPPRGPWRLSPPFVGFAPRGFCPRLRPRGFSLPAGSDSLFSAFRLLPAVRRLSGLFRGFRALRGAGARFKNPYESPARAAPRFASSMPARDALRLRRGLEGMYELSDTNVPHLNRPRRRVSA